MLIWEDRSPFKEHLDNRYSTISSNNQIAQPRTTASRFEFQPQFTLNLIVDLKLIVSKINVHFIVLLRIIIFIIKDTY
jgi:hypothetical protein